jgi:hypothetical protein
MDGLWAGVESDEIEDDTVEEKEVSAHDGQSRSAGSVQHPPCIPEKSRTQRHTQNEVRIRG